MNKELYCDYSATTPVLPEVLVEMMQYFLGGYGNPSSVYAKGREAKMAIESARTRIANIFKCEPEEIIFTSGGTESDNLAIKGVAQEKGKDKLYITSKIEHPAILNTFKELERLGYRVMYLDVDKYGFINIQQIEQVITDKEDIALVSIMYANNELGTIQHIDLISQMLKKYDKNIIFHTDAVQAVGKKEIILDGSNIDLLSASGHKFGAPKGVGFLYKRNGIKLNCQNIGGGQELGLRSGTENVAGIVGMAKALEIHMNNLYYNLNELQKKENYFINLLLHIGMDNNIIHFNSIKPDGSKRKIGGVINVRFDNVGSQSLLLYLDNKNICVSAGSACHSDSDTPSHVLKSIELTDEEALSSIRISFDNTITIDELDYLAQSIKEGVDYCRQMTIST